jgi:hypothetical protein
MKPVYICDINGAILTSKFELKRKAALDLIQTKGYIKFRFGTYYKLISCFVLMLEWLLSKLKSEVGPFLYCPYCYVECSGAIVHACFGKLQQ